VVAVNDMMLEGHAGNRTGSAATEPPALPSSSEHQHPRDAIFAYGSMPADVTFACGETIDNSDAIFADARFAPQMRLLPTPSVDVFGCELCLRHCRTRNNIR
jgi:hypothetical protein